MLQCILGFIKYTCWLYKHIVSILLSQNPHIPHKQPRSSRSPHAVPYLVLNWLWKFALGPRELYWLYKLWRTTMLTLNATEHSCQVPPQILRILNLLNVIWNFVDSKDMPKLLKDLNVSNMFHKCTIIQQNISKHFFTDS